MPRRADNPYPFRQWESTPVASSKSMQGQRGIAGRSSLATVVPQPHVFASPLYLQGACLGGPTPSGSSTVPSGLDIPGIQSFNNFHFSTQPRGFHPHMVDKHYRGWKIHCSVLWQDPWEPSRTEVMLPHQFHSSWQARYGVENLWTQHASTLQTRGIEPSLADALHSRAR